MKLSRRGFLAALTSSTFVSQFPYTFALSDDDKQSNKDGRSFRNYKEAPEHVRKFYKEHHEKQTYAFARDQLALYQPLQQGEETAWGMLEQLDKVVDNSDPDIDLSQLQHSYQAAEAIRRDGLPEWLQVVGFIHDMGKALVFWGEPQWAVVGDTFPTGLRHSEQIVCFDYLKTNPDLKIPAMNTEYGLYQPGVGLDNVTMTWGHDEYLYQVLKNQSRLPEEALFVIRYHSLYPLHTAREPRYLQLMNDQDRQNMKWVEIFNQYDLYSKSSETYKGKKPLEKHYRELVAQYIPGKIRW
ncbi:inositol oxygenase family protein [Endozoicomonas numazuensis]|uniref:inositol oxygenase family protein n=1 Tax=Endozoicomonas numazuensis TaxID=1137799 RepID=UPI0006925651|nr:inositol oxygenase family protein [Endozoicomonas numazuensis]